MEKAAATFRASHDSIITFVKFIVRNREATKRDVIAALDGHNKLESLSLSDASNKIDISLTHVNWRFLMAYAVGSLASTLYLLLWIQCS